MVGEARLVADQLGPPLDREEEGPHAEHPRCALVGEPDPRVGLDVGDHARILAREEEGVAVERHLAIVAHRPRRDGAALGAGGKDREVDVLHLLRKGGKALVGHVWFSWSGSSRRERGGGSKGSARQTPARPLDTACSPPDHRDGVRLPMGHFSNATFERMRSAQMGNVPAAVSKCLVSTPSQGNEPSGAGPSGQPWRGFAGFGPPPRRRGAGR